MVTSVNPHDTKLSAHNYAAVATPTQSDSRRILRYDLIDREHMSTNYQAISDDNFFITKLKGQMNDALPN